MWHLFELKPEKLVQHCIKQPAYCQKHTETGREKLIACLGLDLGFFFTPDHGLDLGELVDSRENKNVRLCFGTAASIASSSGFA